MIMIKLSDGCWVAADQIASVIINTYATHATVRMKDGIGHSIGNDYGVSIHETVERLIKKIDHAVETMNGAKNG